MILKPALSALLTTGLISPVKAEVYVPHKPSIVRPENLEFSKNMLAMPLTMGMLIPAAQARPTLISTQRFSGTGNALNTNLTIPANTVLTVAAFSVYLITVARTLTSITVGGNNMTAAVAYQQGGGDRMGLGIYYYAGALSGTVNFTSTFSGGGDTRQYTFYYFSSYNTSSIVGQSAVNFVSTGTTSQVVFAPNSSLPYIIAVNVSNQDSTARTYTNLTNDYSASLTGSTTASHISASNGTLTSPGSTTFAANGSVSGYFGIAAAEFKS